MKDCFWCKKSCPMDEEGSFELDPEDENIELGWICNHCVAAYLGLCDCEVCVLSDPQMPVPSEEELKKRLKEYNFAHPKKTCLLVSLLARLKELVYG